MGAQGIERCYLQRTSDQVRGALAEVGAQARCSSKVFNDRSKGHEIVHMWSEESDYIICIDGGALSKSCGR
jgi:hypothetical protein